MARDERPARLFLVTTQISKKWDIDGGVRSIYAVINALFAVEWSDVGVCGGKGIELVNGGWQRSRKSRRARLEPSRFCRRTELFILSGVVVRTANDNIFRSA
jgi:hypothetical protein